jgi:hypothetical protein
VKATELNAQGRWNALCGDQGWNESSQLQILEDFIAAKGLMAELAEYAAEVAQEENSGDELLCDYVASPAPVITQTYEGAIQRLVDSTGARERVAIDHHDALVEALKAARTTLVDLDNDWPKRELHEPIEDTISRATELLRSLGKLDL